ncbi:T9SS type A sorting domain-containing protein, partial [Flavobacterium sp. LMO8]|uniref:T9SS type A sorting domain-containing protein n=1 Tax=Flavobacterium sp. LMO8 TaxID=2654244 RepID=UPI0012919582
GYNYFNGAIDDLKIYNYALNATEISSLYTNNTLSTSDFSQNNLEVALYPNPVNDILNIETALELQSVEIYNIQGQKVLSSNQKQINVSDLAAGMYMVRIQDIDNNIATKKIVIK